MTFYFPDSETGYYEDELSFFAHDRELELAAQNREDRLEAQAEEMHSQMWAGEENLIPADRPRDPLFDDTEDAIDLETGCTAAEMREEEIDLPHSVEMRVLSAEGRVA